MSAGDRRARVAAARAAVIGAAAALLAVAPAAGAAAAAAPAPLSGTYAFTGATLVDPPPGEPRDTRVVMTLDGAAARDVYAKMKVPARRDACLDDGSTTKRAGDLACTATARPKGYTCTFGVDLVRGRLAPGAVC